MCPFLRIIATGSPVSGLVSTITFSVVASSCIDSVYHASILPATLTTVPNMLCNVRSFALANFLNLSQSVFRTRTPRVFCFFLFFISTVYMPAYLHASPEHAIMDFRQIEAVEQSATLFITLYSEQNTMAKRYHVTRVRHQLEGTVVEATSPEQAIELSRKTKRSAWSHIDSKRRRSYKADEVADRVKGN